MNYEVGSVIRIVYESKRLTTGLSDVSINLFNENGSEIVTGSIMTEVGSGIYYFDYIPLNVGTHLYHVNSASQPRISIDKLVVQNTASLVSDNASTGGWDISADMVMDFRKLRDNIILKKDLDGFVGSLEDIIESRIGDLIENKIGVLIDNKVSEVKINLKSRVDINTDKILTGLNDNIKVSQNISEEMKQKIDMSFKVFNRSNEIIADNLVKDINDGMNKEMNLWKSDAGSIKEDIVYGVESIHQGINKLDMINYENKDIIESVKTDINSQISKLNNKTKELSLMYESNERMIDTTRTTMNDMSNVHLNRNEEYNKTMLSWYSNLLDKYQKIEGKYNEIYESVEKIKEGGGFELRTYVKDSLDSFSEQLNKTENLKQNLDYLSKLRNIKDE